MADRIQHDLVAMISDLHIGDPTNTRLEDFDRDDAFARLLGEELPSRAQGKKVSLVIGGDFIDFPQIMPELGKLSPAERLGTTEKESLERVRRALEGHGKIFEALGRFCEQGNQVLVLPGNHDIDLHFSSVFDAIKDKAGKPGSLEFVREGAIDERGIYLEHGNQYAYDNWFEFWQDPRRKDEKEVTRIERPWGTYFMDIVYNDVEFAYPFVNKVYPHAALARIVFKLLREDTRVSIGALARLLAFFVLHGKRMAWNRLLGEEKEAPSATAEPSTTEVGAVFTELAGSVEATGRQEEIIEETLKLLSASAASVPKNAPVDDPPQKDVLGRNDERGLEKKAHELLSSGEVYVVGFGHTHEASFSETKLSGGRRTWVVNTGSWMPMIRVPKGETPTLEAIAEMPKEHALKYLWIELGDAPVASLEGLAD